MLEEGADISWSTVRRSTTRTWGGAGGLSLMPEIILVCGINNVPTDFFFLLNVLWICSTVLQDHPLFLSPLFHTWYFSYPLAIFLLLPCQ